MESGGRSFNVLVVEDYPDVAERMKILIERLGHRASVAGSVAGAVENASKESFDLLLIDHRLPDGTGSEILQRLPSGRRARAVLLTAFDEVSLPPSVTEGFSMVLRKPVDFEELGRAIDRLCEG